MSSYTDVVVIRHPEPGAVQVCLKSGKIWKLKSGNCAVWHKRDVLRDTLVLRPGG